MTTSPSQKILSLWHALRFQESSRGHFLSARSTCCFWTSCGHPFQWAFHHSSVFFKQCWLDGMLKHTIQPPNSSHEISIYCSVILTLQHSCGYRRDQNLRDYLIRSTVINPTSADEDRGTFPCGRFCCNTSTFLDTPGGRIDFNQNISVDARTWSML